ncbi:hypothetical protein RUM44_007334 [Polyplax serrata]|uniref:Uncharacterized protein n=1 Tax=Polyplax serrata TaxID=468196 RepID=A0ABR1B283_POLSC
MSYGFEYLRRSQATGRSIDPIDRSIDRSERKGTSYPGVWGTGHQSGHSLTFPHSLPFSIYSRFTGERVPAPVAATLTVTARLSVGTEFRGWDWGLGEKRDDKKYVEVRLGGGKFSSGLGCNGADSGPGKGVDRVRTGEGRESENKRK